MRVLGRAGVAALAVSCFLPGCKVGPTYKRPEMALPANFAEAPGPATQTVDVARWWTRFNDPLLNRLVDNAVASNLDLRLAEARVREARAARRVTRADLFPNANVGGSYTRSRSSENAFDFGGVEGIENGGNGEIPPGGFGNFALPGDERSLYQAGFDAGWEIDVFGGVRRGVEAADADVAAAVEGRRDTLVTLLAEVARNYLELRGFQRQLAIANQNLEAQRDTLGLTEARFQAKLISELDVTRARALVATTGATIPALETQRNQAAHRLGVLLGREPGALMDELLREDDAAGRIPAGPPEVPAGLPSDLLRRRADVRRAERELAAATARIGVATADLFPRFSLTGSLGLQSEQFKDLGRLDSHFYSIGPSVSWPIFDAGRIGANIRVQNARQEQALVRYQQAVLTSLRDVEDALVAHGKERSRRQALGEAVAANRRSVELANQLYTRGLTDFLDVLEAQRALLASEDALTQSERSISTNLVALYKALGGGWESVERVEEPPVPKP